LKEAAELRKQADDLDPPAAVAAVEAKPAVKAQAKPAAKTATKAPVKTVAKTIAKTTSKVVESKETSDV
jgi:hypothetical protein